MNTKNTVSRPPIVVVLGHVDHGKTTLLDAIRKTDIAKKEAGGITQKIGASQITVQGERKITFIDTPGHAAFSQMRSRGAKVADLAILVVAADDGVQPQTKEAIEHIRESQLPFIVAITKADLPSASAETVLGQLEKEGVSLEKRGGDNPWLPISAKTGTGIQDLLDLILLLAEVKEIKGDPEGPLEAVVIETSKSKGGCLISAVVRNGKISLGDTIFAEKENCKVKNLTTTTGPVTEVKPGDPVQILGFSRLPVVGDKIRATAIPFTFSDSQSLRNQAEITEGQIGIILKAQNAGSLEAIIDSLPEEIAVVGSGVGDIFEGDVLSAKASGAELIISFESKPASSVLKLAEAEGVEIISFDIVYKLFEELEERIKKGKAVVLGKAEVIAEFPFDGKKIAGCRVTQGKITKGDEILLMRGEEQVAKVKAVSLKKQKQEISEATGGVEFGVLFEPQFDFKVGDVLISQQR